MRWLDAEHERDFYGAPTKLALALRALRNDGCACDDSGDEECLACVCEAGLKELWDRWARLKERADGNQD